MSENNFVSKRKKFVREISPTWWKRKDFYRAYMMREATSIPTIWFCFELLYGILSFKNPGMARDFLDFLRNPVVLLLNFVTIIMICINTFTWFNLTPKALNLIYRNERLPQSVVRNLMWVVTILVTIVALVLVFLRYRYY